MFAETTNVFPGCFRRSARRVDMLREFHLALAGRGEVNGSNASRDGNGGFREAQMCRSNVDGFKHICTAISVPWRIPVRFKGTKFTSRPDRVPARRSLGPGGDRRVPQPRDERLMNLAHRCSCFAGDICGRCFSSLGGGCARRLRGSIPFPPSPTPSAVPLKSSQIVLARWYVLTRRPPRQSNAANRLLRSATHPVATSTKRYIDVHNAVNCTAAKKAQKLQPS